MFKLKNTLKANEEVNNNKLTILSHELSSMNCNIDTLKEYIRRIERKMDKLDVDIVCHTFQMSDFKKNNNLKIKLEDEEMRKKINLDIESIVSMINEMSNDNRNEDIKMCYTYLEICRQAIAGLYASDKK